MPDSKRTVPLFAQYRPLPGAFDECFDAEGRVRPEARHVIELLEGLGAREFKARQRLADTTFLKSGITFFVYSDRRGAERIFPFDLIPRIVPADEWSRSGRLRHADRPAGLAARAPGLP